ncbi:unnamed protein product [Paramecium primaurelia]|uniref:Uncharacterized protein n=1 Tax=Paramecium primaurelia TaxID=5886 RepID=A0A8S1MAX9_PARPR|nr:unnamed protein product [Paramecium primaurelia]
MYYNIGYTDGQRVEASLIQPKDRLIWDKEIVTIEKQSKIIQGEIKIDIKEKNSYKKELATDLNWDEKFNQ